MDFSDKLGENSNVDLRDLEFEFRLATLNLKLPKVNILICIRAEHFRNASQSSDSGVQLTMSVSTNGKKKITNFLVSKFL